MMINTAAQEAENSVIGSILIDPRCLPVVEEVLRPEDLYLQANQEIYQAALRLSGRGEAIDPVLIQQDAGKNGVQVSSQFLLELMNTTPTAANVKMYADIVREYALKRGIESLTFRAQQRAAGPEDPQDILSDLIGEATSLQQEGTMKDLLSPNDLASRFMDHRIRVESGNASAFVPTFYRDLDLILGGGMLASGMYILAARPGMGKSTLAINIADRVAKSIGSVLFVSLEMDDEQISAKRVSRESGIPGNRILMDKLSEKENEKVTEAIERVAALPVSVNGKPSATVKEIISLARRVPGLKLIVVDYLGKVSPGKRGNQSRYEYTTEISGDLKTMARTFKIPVLVLCQLNRSTESRSDKRPQLSDLRDTGAAEQDADGVIFLYRSDYYGNERDKDPLMPEEVEVIVAKNRHAGTGDCKLAMYPFVSKFVTTSNDPRTAYKNYRKTGNE